MINSSFTKKHHDTEGFSENLCKKVNNNKRKDSGLSRRQKLKPPSCSHVVLNNASSLLWSLLPEMSACTYLANAVCFHTMKVSQFPHLLLNPYFFPRVFASGSLLCQRSGLIDMNEESACFWLNANVCLNTGAFSHAPPQWIGQRSGSAAAQPSEVCYETPQPVLGRAMFTFSCKNKKVEERSTSLLVCWTWLSKSRSMLVNLIN